ncbi:WalW protein [Sphingomonas sp. PB2P12]|uniref:WalW protein n=1 Tax=Sphingomonas sandaracina TaxID=3096157 RepID=UPI002FC7A26B
MISDRAFRPPRPTNAQRIAWPDAFGTRFTVMVDVEEEFDWDAPFDARNRATTAMTAFPEAHRRFAERGVGLTCMVDHPIVTDPRAVAILTRVVEDGRSAIGSQLHPWVNPPFQDGAGETSTFAGNLPAAVEAAKLETLTRDIAAAFGVRPRVYRAGRYGIGPRSFDLLEALGYRIDSSVRPGYDYRPKGGPDFGMADAHAYRAGGIVELPLTTVFTGHARRGGARLYRALGGIPKGLGLFARTGLLSRIALTPEDMPIDAALEAVAVALGEGVRLLNLSFHSPSLVPGHTPYVRDAAGLKRFHAWWTTMLDEFDRRGIRNASLDEILTALG